ncbi:hypothetical protein B0H17DRAFT_1129809 [Mycena rosella]|uniref:Uncharacterized protein n=1 Tax=Mycena rosella TaxID=1033263 RepID=A0AAD7GJY3_MYCRO|nr:hypothetical protein B0H17DRAFT_1129809 [Mycena rosella]
MPSDGSPTTGLRGCRPVGNTDEIFPISDFPIRPNDRSPTDVPLDSKEGSYNLVNTVLKGIGSGVVVPAAQVDTPEFAGQVCTVLKSLGSLRRRLLRKTLSKYEYDVTEFNADDMNVVGFGGLEPNNATSCQLNLSTPWQRLMHALGQQDSDSGSFLLAWAGVYIREINAWALYLFFDGVDIHTGIGATTTYSRAEFKQWMEADLEMAWNRSELWRMGIVQYASRSAHSRDTYMFMTPSVRFGNCAPEQHHLAIQRDFATHGQEILGGQEPWANRMGREIIYAFWNKLQLCNLDLGIDLNKIIQSISFKDKDSHDIPLQPLPFHPVDDAKHIALYRGYFEYYRQQCAHMRLNIGKHQFLRFRESLRNDTYDPVEDPEQVLFNWKSRSSIPTKSGSGLNAPPPGTDFCGMVVKIVEHIRVANRGCYRVLTDDSDHTPRLVQENDPRLPCEMVKAFIAAELRKFFALPILETQNNLHPPTLMPTGSSSANDDIEMEETQLSGSNPSGSGDTNNLNSSDAPALSSSSNSLEREHAQATHSNPSQESTNDVSKGKGKERSEGSDEPSTSESDPQWDIEAILEMVQDNQGTWYRCKFAADDSRGCPKESEGWAHENDLSAGCDKLLEDFYKSLADQNTTPSEDSSCSDSSDEDEQPRKKQKAVKKDPTLKYLESLLNVERLKSEVEMINTDRLTNSRGSNLMLGALTSSSFAPTILEMCLTHNSAISMLDVVVGNSASTPLEVACAQFTKISTSAGAMVKLAAFQRATTLLTRILRWTNSRALIIIYRWCTVAGPRTIQGLFDLHREKGFSAFTAMPTLGHLVDHIVQFVFGEKITRMEKEKSRRAEARKRSTRAANKDTTAATPTHGKFGPIRTDLNHIPADLYGVLAKGKKNGPHIRLLDPGGGLQLNLYAACQWFLLDVFFRGIIMPALRGLMEIPDTAKSHSRMDTDSAVYNRAICRGAVLECLLEACGDDGISVRMHWMMCSIVLGCPAILHRTETVLSGLRDWLEERVEDNPTIPALTKSLGDEIHTVLQELAAGEPHPDAIRALPPPAKTPRKTVKSKPKKDPPQYTSPEIDTIIPAGSLPNFTLPAVIIREALNLERSLPPGAHALRCVLQGHHASQNSRRDRNLDWVNPRRQFNRYTFLFQQNFPGVKLTGPVGLSNALSWFGTGQGSGTERFLVSLSPIGGFFADDVATMVQNFENIISQNVHSAEKIQFDNQKAWGNQPNPELAAQPTVRREGKRKPRAVVGHKRKRATSENFALKEKASLESKFGRFFAADVQEKWISHLGELAHKDPSTDQAPRPSWASTIRLISNLNIPAFKTGLTAMQLVNTLAFSQVVQLPSVSEMASWIADNPSLGAVTGLEFLGFQTNSRNHIQGSYICFHNYLDKYLVKEDRETLGFHPPFSEHLLCKVPRLDKYLSADNGPRLSQIAESLGAVKWIPGENITDSRALPFPCPATRDTLETALKAAEHP